jgi:dynein heavy chain
VYECLVGDVLISCGMIAYLGPYTSFYRLENLAKWSDYVGQLGIPHSENYSFVQVLGSEIKINSWNIYGLPRDSFSIENAIIMDSTKRCSLFIDPQSQANKWIRNMEKENELKIIKLSDQNYMKIVEQSIEQGNEFLILDVYLVDALNSLSFYFWYKRYGY